MRLQVRQVDISSDFGLGLTFGQMYPPEEAMGKVNIWSDFGLVRCTPPIIANQNLS